MACFSCFSLLRLQFAVVAGGHGVAVLEVEAVGAGVVEARLGGNLLDAEVRTRDEQVAGILQTAVADEVGKAVELGTLGEGSTHTPLRQLEHIHDLLAVQIRIEIKMLALDSMAQAAEQLVVGNVVKR